MHARHWHRPGAFAIALTLAGIALFVALGLWQVRRAHEKIAMLAAFDVAATQAPIALEQARGEATAQRYPKVRVSGRFDPQRAWLLDNQMRDGHAGVMVYALFGLQEGGAPLLVNRGFLPRDARGELAPIPPLPEGAQTLVGLYAPPPGVGVRLGGNRLPMQTAWPKTSIYIDLDEIGADLGRRLDPRVLLLAPQAGSGFVREWRPDVLPPQRHYGYAFTWFTFAAVAAVIFLILHWRKEQGPT